ncbi:MAG: hypothetical protein FD167_4772 [bacterium]|nr:MAG: hypothetical protein FD167_4772 [bacterium]
MDIVKANDLGERMNFKYKLLVSALLTLSSPFIDGNVWLFALQKPGQRQTQPVQQPIEKQKTESTTIPETSDLAKEIRVLSKEIRQLNAQQRQILDLIFLKIEQERIDKISDKFVAIEAQLRILDSRERQLEFRLKNIDKEFLTRSFLNRSDGERIIKAEIQDEKEQIRLERNRLELERQTLRENINVGNRQLDIIRTRLLTGLTGNGENSKQIVDYLEEQDQIIPIQTDPAIPKEE